MARLRDMLLSAVIFFLGSRLDKARFYEKRCALGGSALAARVLEVFCLKTFLEKQSPKEVAKP